MPRHWIKLGRLTRRLRPTTSSPASIPINRGRGRLSDISTTESKRYDQSASAFQKSLALKHDQPEVLLALGQTQTDQGKLSDAIQSSEHCLALKPDEFHATYNLGNAYYAQKGIRQVCHLLRKSLRAKARLS